MFNFFKKPKRTPLDIHQSRIPLSGFEKLVKAIKVKINRIIHHGRI